MYFGRTGVRMILATATFLAGVVEANATTPDATPPEFLAKYRCSVIQRLRMIYTNRDREMDRYLILASRHDGAHYTQCLFIDNDTRVLCEASSGYYTALEGQPRLYNPGPTTRAQLAKLGFSLDDLDGNFQRFHPVRNDDDLGAIANLLLSTMYLAYRVRHPVLTVEVEAPLATGFGDRLRVCSAQ